MSFNTTFKNISSGQFYWWRKMEHLQKKPLTYHQVIDKPFHLKLHQVHVNRNQILRLWCLTPLPTIFQLYLGIVFLVEEIGVPGENHRLAASHWQTLSHNVASSTICLSRIRLTMLVMIGTDCRGIYKSNYSETCLNRKPA